MSNDGSKILQLLNLLQDPKSESARKKYLALFNLEKIYDQKVYERIEDLVMNATLMKDSAVEVQTDLAQQMLILLKGGLKRPRGGQQSTRYQKLRLRTLVGLGRRIKKELIQDGLTATEARARAPAHVRTAPAVGACRRHELPSRRRATLRHALPASRRMLGFRTRGY